MAQTLKKYYRKCPNCGKEICYKSERGYTDALKSNSKCASCTLLKYYKNATPVNTVYKNEQKINELKEIYYDKNKSLNDIAVELNISRRLLYKMIKYHKLPKIHRNFIRYGMLYGEKNDYYKYVTIVRKFSRINLKKNINKFDKILLKNVCKNKENCYHLDHIVSINEGFKNNVPPFYIADIKNLRLLPYKDNLKKHNKSDMDVNQLIDEILKMK